MSNKKEDTTETVTETTSAAVETTTETKKTKATKTVKQTEKKAKVMYVGPTLTGVAIQNRVYTEIPAAAVELIKTEAELGNLFVSVTDYPKANKMIREQSGYIYRAYEKALKLKK